MSTTFSAGPQSLGYLYQARYGLYALLSDDRPEATLTIEGLDDIAVQGDSHIKLEQLKHHVKEAASLTNYSIELWKTIRVWSESLKKGHWKPEEVILNLVTTAKVTPNTAAAFLSSGKERDEAEALRQLVDVANTSKNNSLLPAFDAFKNLRHIQQERLLSAITICDSSANIQDVVPLIKRQIKFATARVNIDLLYEQLEGWWFNKVVLQLINDSSQPIRQLEIEEKINSLSEQFRRDSLPIEFQDEEPEEDYYEKADNMLFVNQLKHLKINTRRVRNAILDYYQTFEQRSKWVSDNLYIDEELAVYEKRLKREWDRYTAILADSLTDIENEENCQLFGRDVFNWMERQQTPIRSNMPTGHEFICRGSYHILADKNPPSVYWHPRFLEIMEEIMNKYE